MGMDYLLGVLGLIFLVGGAEIFVRGAVQLSLRLHVSPILIGLTVVAFGTSAPEFAVSLGATMKGSVDLAVGNIVGSNIFNILLILGLSATIRPLSVHQEIVRREIPIMVGAVLTLFLFSQNGELGRIESFILFAGLIGYLYFQILLAKKEKKKNKEIEKEKPKGILLILGLIGGGLVGLTFGSHLLVESASAIARAWGVSEAIIGLTIVSIGTSLPEVATSVVAAIGGRNEIAISNVVGSNLFNTLGVLGLTGCLSPEAILIEPSVLNFDLPFMTAVCFSCLPIVISGYQINRWEGTLFLLYAVGYLSFLYLKSQKHAALESYSMVFLNWILPFTVGFLAISLWKSFRPSRA